MAEVLERFQNIGATALAELDQIADLDTLEQYRIKYLSRNGKITALLAELGKLPKDVKPQAGKLANQVKQQVTKAFNGKKGSLENAGTVSTGPFFDISLPGVPVNLGTSHLITRTIDELLGIFGLMGFDIGFGPEVEDDYHNFVALNIPDSHPARDPLDNFYIDDTTLLRSQTSTMQIRVMENTEPPIRVVAPGRVFRPDDVDATHMFMFHQMEALVVDEGVSMVDLKTTIDQFIKAYYGQDTEWRFRPSFFPFTEPSCEIDLLMKDKQGKDVWIEVGGCGMVNPNVFKAVGYDPEKYTGWAFGLGIERLAMRKYGITDIRLFYENDIRFLNQF